MSFRVFPSSLTTVLAGLCLLGIGACTPAEQDAKLTRKEGSKGSSASSSSGNSQDGVVAPTPVTGTYLTCALERLATESNPSSQMACALADAATHKKVDLEKLVLNPEFSLAPLPQIQISRLILNADPRWHILFTLKAASASEANTALKQGTVNFTAQSKDPAVKALITQNAKVTDALTATAQSVPESSLDGNSSQIQSLALASQTSNGQIQYACRGYSTTDKGFHLGRLLAGEDRCAFAYATSSERSAVFDYISAQVTQTWVTGSNGSIPTNALALGKEGNGSPQYLCRAQVASEGLVYGKIAQGYNGCNIYAVSGYIQVTSYEILAP